MGLCGTLGAVAQTSPQYAVLPSKNVMITMRDGIKLAADVYRPARNGVPAPGRFPTLLLRTPYDRSFEESWDAAYFVPRG